MRRAGRAGGIGCVGARPSRGSAGRSGRSAGGAARTAQTIGRGKIRRPEMAADWDALHRALWAAVRGHEARLGESAQEYTAAIVEAIRAGGFALSDEARRRIEDYTDAAEGLIREGIAQAVAPVAAATLGAGMRSAFVAEAAEAAWGRRWPDGLKLSERVWGWQRETAEGVSRVLQAGVRMGRGVDAVVMDMQRSIERTEGGRFALVVRDDDPDGLGWDRRLYDAARGVAQTAQDLNAWARVVDEARESIERLKVGGTRRQAEAFLGAVRAGLRAGRQDLVERAMAVWQIGRAHV